MVHITPSRENEFEGQSVILECIGSVKPIKTTPQLAHADHITVKWFGPDGSQMIGREQNSDAGSTNTLTIANTDFMDSGLYTCEVTLDLPIIPLSHTQYHLTILSKFCVRDFDKILYNHLILSENLTVSLPDYVLVCI